MNAFSEGVCFLWRIFHNLAEPSSIHLSALIMVLPPVFISLHLLLTPHGVLKACICIVTVLQDEMLLYK